MNAFNPIVDTNFREYAELQLHRHNLLMVGKEGVPEVEQIEDEMTELWDKFNVTQRQSLNGMGSDLNWIRRKGELPPKSHKSEEVAPTDKQELLAAKLSNEWHGLLHYLRVCSPIIRSVNLAYLRGQAYGAIGLPAYAFSFYDFTTELEPANASMGVIAVRAMAQLDLAKTLSRAEQVLKTSSRFSPPVVAMCTVMILRRDEAEDRPIDKGNYEKILEDSIKRLKLEPLSIAEQSMVYQLAASGFEAIDNMPIALKCYEEGLSLSPDNEVLLIGKGLLLYGSRTEEAVAAFQRVVSHEGTPLVWPYFFLAHYFLLQKNYDDALKVAKQAWDRATTDPIRAELLGWQAICLSERGYPPEMVRPWFEKAISLDPSNERIKRNSGAFEETLSADSGRVWDIEAKETLRVERSPSMTNLELLAVA